MKRNERARGKRKQKHKTFPYLGRDAGADADGGQARRGAADGRSRARRRGRAARESGGAVVLFYKTKRKKERRFFFEPSFFFFSPFSVSSKRKKKRSIPIVVPFLSFHRRISIRIKRQRHAEYETFPLSAWALAKKTRDTFFFSRSIPVVANQRKSSVVRPPFVSRSFVLVRSKK